ncbi:MAG: hypothetical protein PUD65_00030 [Spirochaetales bacterium]|nr:hypothetical protein [Spirochaetales bacterium]
MKKTRLFIFITALLITLLMVVGCDVSPVSMNNGLVRASLSLDKNTKDIVIIDYSADVTSYRIALVPCWEQLLNGTKPYGGFGSVDENDNIVEGNVYISSNVSSIDLGFLTPGQWTIYVEALNSSGVVLQKGKVSKFFTKNSDNEATVFLLPVTGKKGKLIFSISIQQLELKDFTTKYSLRYTIDGANLKETLSGDLTPTKTADYRVHYKNELSISQGDYLVTVILVQNDGTEEGKTVGGITRVVRVVESKSESDSSWFWGDITPEDFIQVGVDVAAPSIKTSLSTSFKGSTVKDGTTISFTCKDESANTEDYNREFIWYVNGDMVLSTTSETAESVFSNESCFSEYGNYEVRCEVVYYTDNISFIGGSSVKFQIIP